MSVLDGVRPDLLNFTPPIGHERRWEALVNAYRKGTIPQTLLISGPRHVGKTLLVKRFAQLLLCPNVDATSENPAPCLTCRTCHQIDIETFPDFKIYRPAVNSEKEARDRILAPEALEGSILNIETAREFSEEAMHRPLSGQRKVMVLHQAERLEIPAQNSLLKTFEEPIRGLTIVLICENPDELLPTVLSRCWHLPLSATSSARLTMWLQSQFPAASSAAIQGAVQSAHGLPGAAYRALQRMETGEEAPSHHAQIEAVIQRITAGSPVAALGLSEEALRLAKEWWEEDGAGEGLKSLKKGEAKVTRSQVARFLDELAAGYRLHWAQAATRHQEQTSPHSGPHAAEHWARGLDLIRKTRHYILSNSNTHLTLDVLFGRLIGLAHEK